MFLEDKKSIAFSEDLHCNFLTKDSCTACWFFKCSRRVTRRIRLKENQVKLVRNVVTARGTRHVGDYSERTFIIITIDRWSLGSIHRVSQEVGRSDQGPCCPFPFWGAPFRCNGQLKTIQTENPTGSFDKLPNLPSFFMTEFRNWKFSVRRIRYLICMSNSWKLRFFI